MHERIVGLYEDNAAAWDVERGRDLHERNWLDRFLALLPADPEILDIGCGMGEPVAAYLIGRGARITGVDSSPSLIALARARFPKHDWLVGDMRAMDLARRFDGLIAWHSFFHLSPEDQEPMFARFAAHARAGAALMFTSGWARGTAIGEWQSEPLYHASLDPAEYRTLLGANGFEVVDHRVKDADCGGATVWLAQGAGMKTQSNRGPRAMSTTDTVFAGSIPAVYDRYMVPLLFRPYAQEVARRAAALRPATILETAAGTGVVTEALHRALPEAQIVATDLNPPMLEEAARRVSAPNVSFRPADAAALPFEDGCFDLVVCQFGIMFFPDKVRANAEARRVLRDGGTYLLVIWDRVDRNLATHVTGAAVAERFPEEASAFFERIPFRYHERAVIEADLKAAGFTDIAFETVELRSRAASAHDAALGLTQGTPMRTDIEKQGPGALAEATDAAAEALRGFEGPGGFEAPMSAHIVVAAR